MAQPGTWSVSVHTAVPMGGHLPMLYPSADCSAATMNLWTPGLAIRLSGGKFVIERPIGLSNPLMISELLQGCRVTGCVR